MNLIRFEYNSVKNIPSGPIEEFRICKKQRRTQKDQRTPEGNRPGEWRPASSSGRRSQRLIVPCGTDEEAIALGRSWEAGTALRPHAGSSDGDTAIEGLSEVVTWSVLVRGLRLKRMKNLVCDDLVVRWGAADNLFCVRGRRTSRCGWSGGSVSREWRISPVKESTTRLKFARFGSVSRTCHIQLDELLDSNHTKRKVFPKRLLVQFVFFVLFESNVEVPAWLFIFQPIRCESKETKNRSTEYQ